VVLTRVDASHVAAQRAIDHRECGDEQSGLEEAGGRVRHSETLREQQGDHEVAEDEERHDEGYGVLGAHSRSTALRTSAATMKKRPLNARKARSAMRYLQI
jgi:hypothetical protein